MPLRMKEVFNILVGGLCFTAMFAHAKTNEPLLIFDDPNNDFLLPSYFDTPVPSPAPVVVQPVQSLQPIQSVQPVPTQNVPADIDILKEIFGDQAVNSVPLSPAQPAKRTTTQTFYPTPRSVQQSKQIPLLTPLAPLPQVPEATIPPPKHFQRSSPYASKLIAKETGKSKANIQLPKDIRLQFTRGATQLTDQAVKWLSAYALHVQKDPTKVVNLRVSAQDWDIQQARLGIIMQLLFEKGLPVRQIQIYQSDRDPDSLIIGADINPNQTRAIVPEETKRVIKEQKTLIW